MQDKRREGNEKARVSHVFAACLNDPRSSYLNQEEEHSSPEEVTAAAVNSKRIQLTGTSLTSPK